MPSLKFKKDDYVKVVGVDGNFRYGYIKELQEGGWHFLVCLHEEGDSKIGYDKASGQQIVSLTSLTECERQFVPLMAQALSTKALADRLHLSPVTVRQYYRTLRLKFRLQNREQLCAYCQGLEKLL